MTKEVRHRNSDLVECGVDEYALLDAKPKKEAPKKKESKEE